MRPKRILTLASVSLFLLSGCAAGRVREVPVKLKYVEVKSTPPKPASLSTVAIGAFRDVRKARDADIVGERTYYDRRVDRYRAREGLDAAVSGVLRSFYGRRGVRVINSRWTGEIDRIWDEKGDIVISGKITRLWFSSRDYFFQSRANSDLQLVLKIGSPRSGTVITKTITIEPAKRSNVFWERKAIESWLSESISDAFERVLPEVERRLTN